MHKFLNFLIFLIVLFLIGCSSTRKNSSKKVYQKYLDEGYQCEYNADSTMLLCIGDYKEILTLKEIRVVKPDVDSVIYRENVQLLQAGWIDIHTIEIVKSLGITGNNQGKQIYRINLNTLEKRTITEEIKNK